MDTAEQVRTWGVDAHGSIVEGFCERDAAKMRADGRTVYTSLADALSVSVAIRTAQNGTGWLVSRYGADRRRPDSTHRDSPDGRPGRDHAVCFAVLAYRGQPSYETREAALAAADEMARNRELTTCVTHLLDNPHQHAEHSALTIQAAIDRARRKGGNLVKSARRRAESRDPGWNDDCGWDDIAEAINDGARLLATADYLEERPNRRRSESLDWIGVRMGRYDAIEEKRCP